MTEGNKWDKKIANLEKLEARKYIERSAAAGHAYDIRSSEKAALTTLEPGTPECGPTVVQ